MAALSSRRPEKRSLPLSSGDTEEPPSKQQKRTVHQHRVRYKQDVGPNRILHDDEAHFLLTRSVALALTVAGFDGAEPVAIESFRAEVEEYILHLMSTVTMSMLASRRVTPIPDDFAAALDRERLSLSELEFYIRPLVPPSMAQPPLRPSTPEEPAQPTLTPLLGPILSGEHEKSMKKFIPKKFPSFPSKHSYKFTPDFTECDRDPRKIRERATEEGRLGEEALRRLNTAAGGGRLIEVGRAGKEGSKGSRRAQQLAQWAHVMQEATKAAGGSRPLPEDSGVDVSYGEAIRDVPVHLVGPVNYEMRYWRKVPQQLMGMPQQRRKLAAAVENGNGV